MCAYIHGHTHLGNVLKASLAKVTNIVHYNVKEKSRNVKCFPKFVSCQTLSPSLSFSFSQWQTLNIIFKLDLGDASVVCICSERHIHWGGWSFRGGTENCAVMVENAERLIWVHFAAIISLSLSSNKRWRKKKKEKEKTLLHRSTWDVSVTLCWQFSVWVLFRQTQAYQCEPLLSIVDWLSFVLRCNCAAVWH